MTTERITDGLIPRRTVFSSADSESDSVKLLYLRDPATDSHWASTDTDSPWNEALMPEIEGGISAHNGFLKRKRSFTLPTSTGRVRLSGPVW